MAWTATGHTVAVNPPASIGVEDRGGAYYWMYDPDGDWSGAGADRVEIGPARFVTAPMDGEPVELGAGQTGALTLAEAIAAVEAL